MSYQIRGDETCLWCGSRHLSVVDEHEREWHIGMECVLLHCADCDNEFAVDCDEILPDGTLLHDAEEVAS